MNITFTARALLLASLLWAGTAVAQTSDQMPANQGQWQNAPGTTNSPGSNGLPAWLQYKSPYAGKQVDIGVSHLSGTEITAWTQDTVSDVLSFAPDTYATRINGFKKYFATSGWQAYADYVIRNNLPTIVRKQGFTVNAIVKDPPRVLKEGSTSGVYRWLVEAPIVLSLSHSDSKGQTRVVPSTTRQTKITIQIARVGEGQGGPEGLLIENWFSRDRPLMPASAPAQQAPPAAPATAPTQARVPATQP